MTEAIQTKESVLPLLVFLIPTICGLVSLLLVRFRAFHGEWAVLGLGGTFAVSVLIAYEVLQGNILTAWGGHIYVDGLSALMEILGSCMGLIIAFYSVKYIPDRLRRMGEQDIAGRQGIYYGLLLLFLGMMNWTCATNNLIMLYVSLEFTTLATAFLVTFYWKRESMEAGYKYLFLVTVGVLFALMGLVLIYCAAAGMPVMAGKRVLLITELAPVAKMMPLSMVLLGRKRVWFPSMPGCLMPMQRLHSQSAPCFLES